MYLLIKIIFSAIWNGLVVMRKCFEKKKVKTYLFLHRTFSTYYSLHVTCMMFKKKKKKKKKKIFWFSPKGDYIAILGKTYIFLTRIRGNHLQINQWRIQFSDSILLLSVILWRIVRPLPALHCLNKLKKQRLPWNIIHLHRRFLKWNLIFNG